MTKKTNPSLVCAPLASLAKGLCIALTAFVYCPSVFAQNDDAVHVQSQETFRMEPFSQEEPFGRRTGKVQGLLRPDRVGKTDTETPDTVTDFGIPYSDLIRDTQPPYEGNFRNLRVEQSVETKLGQGATEFHANFFRGLKFSTPLDSGLRPETAEFKLGNFYLDIIKASGSIAYTDNEHLTEINREGASAAIMQLHVGALLQLGDNFNFGVRGAFIYLPFENKAGIAGFGVDDIFAQFDYTPLMQAQAAYAFHAGHWNIEALDDFRVRHVRVGEGVDFEFFEGVTFDEQDEAGRYRTPVPTFTTQRRRGNINDEYGTDFLEYRNLLGATANRVIPTETLVEMGAFHENRWYSGNRPVGLPNTHDFAFINLQNQHENMRFKPFAEYRISRYDFNDDWNHRVMGGVRGPVTDYIHILAETGYNWYADTDTGSWLWRFTIDHNPTPLLFHRLQYSRDITEPDQDLRESWTYRLRYRLAQPMWLEVFGIASHYTDLDQTGTGGDEYRAGVRLIYNIAQRTTLRQGVVYSKIQRANPLFADIQRWTARTEIWYRHTDTLDSRLTYQFQDRNSNQLLDDYYENLIIYTLTKRF